MDCAKCPVHLLRASYNFSVLSWELQYNNHTTVRKCIVHRKQYMVSWILENGKQEVEDCILGLPLVPLFCRHQCQAHEFVQVLTLCLLCVFFSPFWLACSRFEVFYPCRPWQQLIQVRFHDLLLTYFLNLHVLTLLTNDN